MATLRSRFESGQAMRAERAAEAALLVWAVTSGALWAAFAACALLAVQALLSPVLSPFGLLWLLVERRAPPARLDRLYYDLAASRGAAFMSALVVLGGLLLARAGHLAPARLVFCLPAASCLLSAAVGFCAGCGYYVLGRELLSRLGLCAKNPEAATDVVLDER